LENEEHLSYSFPHHGNVILDIEKLLLEGWRPRIKKVKERRYITVLKGKKERSLGPYTDELWDKVKPTDPWATPSQISELEKRIDKIEKTKRESNPSLLEKRIDNIDDALRGINSYSEALGLEFFNMMGELLLSARERLRGNTACKHVDEDGVCNYWHWSCHAKQTPEYLRPMKRDEIKGHTIYRVKVIEHELFCSACPEYERKS